MEKQIQEEEAISLKELILKLLEWLRYLLSKWLIILIVGTIGGIIGLIYAYSIKPVYTAGLSFVLEDSQSSGGGLGGYSGLASMVGIDLGTNGGGVFVGDNLMEFMKSRSMIEKALLTSINEAGKEKTLAEFYLDINALRKGWEKDPGLRSIHFLSSEDRSKFTRKKDSVLGACYNNIISNNLSVAKKDKKLGIVTVTTKTENELFSKYFTETLVKVVSNFYVETKTKREAENLFILQHQTDSVRRELNLAISGVAASVDVTPNINPSRQVLRVPSQRRQIDVQANSTILQELEKNLEIAKVSLRKETPLIQVIDSPILPLQIEAYGKRKGVMTGGIIAGFLIAFYFVIKKVLTDLFS